MSLKYNEKEISRWSTVHAYLMIAATIVSITMRQLEITGIIALASFAYFVSMFFPRHPGRANIVTSLRLLLLIGFSLLWQNLTAFRIFLVFGANALLDILDGFLARKYEETSFAGMYFDMEADALFVLLGCLYYYMSGIAGGWVIIPGVMRYMYKIYLSTVDPEGKFVERKKKFAAVIAGLFFVVLCISVILPVPANMWLLMAGSGMLMFSFGVSFIDLVRFLKY